MLAWRKSLILCLGLLLLCSTILIPVQPIQANATFKDVQTGHWAYEAIQWAVQTGLVQGYPDGRYYPNQQLTEAQFVTMLYQFACNKPSRKARSAGKHWADATYEAFAPSNLPLFGYIDQGEKDVPLQRGQLARIVAAFHGLSLTEPYAIQYMYLSDLSTGYTGKKNYQDYGADKPLTRAEAAAFFKKLSAKGSCNLVGLGYGTRSGQDNWRYNPLPPHFLSEQEIVFLTEERLPAYRDSLRRGASTFDVEKETLSASGLDRTFITLDFEGCLGGADLQGSFRVTSLKGADLNQRFRDPIPKIIEDKSADHDQRVVWQTVSTMVVESDGPEVTVEVTSIPSSVPVQDTIVFQYVGSTLPGTCPSRRELTLSYIPQYELHVETDKREVKADGLDQAIIRATVLGPGGQPLYDYNGSVRFRSSTGMDRTVEVTNGVAEISTPPNFCNNGPVRRSMFRW